MPPKRVRNKIKLVDSDDDEVDEDSFKNPNVSIMPDDHEESKTAQMLPQTRLKQGMNPPKVKVVNSRGLLPINKVAANLRDGDLQKLATAVIMEINQMAAQLFELISYLSEVINQKPKKIYKFLANQY